MATNEYSPPLLLFLTHAQPDTNCIIKSLECLSNSEVVNVSQGANSPQFKRYPVSQTTDGARHTFSSFFA